MDPSSTSPTPTQTDTPTSSSSDATPPPASPPSLPPSEPTVAAVPIPESSSPSTTPPPIDSRPTPPAPAPAPDADPDPSAPPAPAPAPSPVLVPLLSPRVEQLVLLTSQPSDLCQIALERGRGDVNRAAGLLLDHPAELFEILWKRQQRAVTATGSTPTAAEATETPTATLDDTSLDPADRRRIVQRILDGGRGGGGGGGRWGSSAGYGRYGGYYGGRRYRNRDSATSSSGTAGAGGANRYTFAPPSDLGTDRDRDRGSSSGFRSRYASDGVIESSLLSLVSAPVESGSVSDDPLLDFDPDEIPDDRLESTFLLNRNSLQMTCPQNADEYSLRMKEYDKDREERKIVYAQGTHESYKLARILYSRAFALIRFVGDVEFEVLVPRLKPVYVLDEHESNLRKYVIVIRKLAECCFYLGRIREGLFCCSIGIETCEKDFPLSSTSSSSLNTISWFVRAIQAKLYVLLKDFPSAGGALETARLIKRESSILAKTHHFIEASRIGAGHEFDGPEWLRMKMVRKGVEKIEWYPGDEVVEARLQYIKWGLGEVMERLGFLLNYVSRYPFMTPMVVSLTGREGDENCEICMFAVVLPIDSLLGV